MSPATKKLLEKFAAKANWGTAGNPADMEGFFDFVISAYRNNEWDIPLDEFLEALGQSKSANSIQTKKKELAAKMFTFNKYEDGIKLLRKYAGK